jgi:hypothetical protein
MPEAKRQNERLVVLLIIGVIALNYPLIFLFSKVRLLFGIPILYLYIFTIWSMLIVCIALILEKPAFPSLMASPPKSEKSE